MFFAQNDGTLMALDYAVRFPILTIGSGPSNSIRGAAFLTGLSDALVADVGGTSTDFGMLVGGFPRESAAAVDIGGVQTNFRMPDVLAIALGGGTVVRESADAGHSRTGQCGISAPRAGTGLRRNHPDNYRRGGSVWSSRHWQPAGRRQAPRRRLGEPWTWLTSRLPMRSTE